MANTATNVTAGKPNTAGAVYVGATTATLPTSTTATMTGFNSLGYISDAGLVHENSPTYQDIKAWGGDVVLSTLTEKKDTFKFTLIETLNEDVMKLIYGDANVTTASEQTTITAKTVDTAEKSFVIDMVLRGGKAKRITIPCARVTNVGAVTYSDSAAVGYEVTITATPNASGVTHYEYIK